MRQAGNPLSQDPAIGGYVAGADLQKIIKGRGHHMALLDLGHGAGGAVEGLQRRLARVRQAHLDKGDMGQPHPHRVQHRAVTGDHACLLQPPDAGLDRGLGQADAAGKVGHRQAAIGREFRQNRLIEPVKVGKVIRTAHAMSFGRFACQQGYYSHIDFQ